MDSALSRTMSISLEDKKCCRGVRFLGFSTPAPVTAESLEEMTERDGEVVTTDEPTVVAKPFLDAVIVQDRQGDGGLSDSTGTDEGERGEIFCEADDLID